VFDLVALQQALAAHGRVARVVIAAHDGSSPREVGAAMLVWGIGTIGHGWRRGAGVGGVGKGAGDAGCGGCAVLRHPAWPRAGPVLRRGGDAVDRGLRPSAGCRGRGHVRAGAGGYAAWRSSGCWRRRGGRGAPRDRAGAGLAGGAGGRSRSGRSGSGARAMSGGRWLLCWRPCRAWRSPGLTSGGAVSRGGAGWRDRAAGPRSRSGGGAGAAGGRASDPDLFPCA
jgi:hypothetical protein